MKKVLAILMFAGLLATSSHAMTMFTVQPLGGIVAGGPGDTVGWGFTLTNTENFLVVTGSMFTPFSPLGTYEDFIGTSSNLVVIGPSPETDSLTQLFNAMLRTGVGAFHINASAPVALIPGTLTIDYALFSRSPNDPNFNPDTDTVMADATLTQAVSVDVVPEPAPWMLISGALPAVLLLRRRRA